MENTSSSSEDSSPSSLILAGWGESSELGLLFGGSGAVCIASSSIVDSTAQRRERAAHFLVSGSNFVEHFGGYVIEGLEESIW